MKTLEQLEWQTVFLSETPGDEVEGGLPRQVHNACWSRVSPTPVPNPRIELESREMMETLDLSELDHGILGGNGICDGMDPWAQCYGGHQFGNWAGQLGDGRAISLGEVIAEDGTWELQLKGSGLTPYSRTADGKAVLRSSIREFLCSEAMFHLGVPTTRALSLATTGQEVVRDIMYDGNPAPEPGAVVCRVAPSFIRFGSFQIHTARGDLETLRKLVDHTINTHFPTVQSTGDERLLDWLSEVARTTAEMVIDWMRVGFVHGVMNTDNMSIHGLTIDYGPYGWLEGYDNHWTPNTTDKHGRRYRFGHQPMIAGWNLARLLEAVAPLFDEPQVLNGIMDLYDSTFVEGHRQMWCQKLGIEEFDEDLITDLVNLLHQEETDMTILFRNLAKVESADAAELGDCFYSEAPEGLEAWIERYLSLASEDRRQAMDLVNPKYVLRNWMAQLAIDKAEGGDFGLCQELMELLKKPYDEQTEHEEQWFQRRPEWARHKVGCSMLSCSS